MTKNSINPDANLLVAEAKRACRLALVVRDEENRKWGLTARHVFGDLEKAPVYSGAGSKIGEWRSEDNEHGFTDLDVKRQITRFRFQDHAVSPKSVGVNVTWPRYAKGDGALMGTRIVSISSRERVIGDVTGVNQFSRFIFRERKEEWQVTGAIAIRLVDDNMVEPGSGGTLLLSELGEAVAMGVALQRVGEETFVIGAPIAEYLEETGLTFWAPYGAQWSDLEYRTKSFLEEVSRDKGPDLGPVPSYWRARR